MTCAECKIDCRGCIHVENKKPMNILVFNSILEDCGIRLTSLEGAEVLMKINEYYEGMMK